MSAPASENPYAGQGAVLLDIGGDVGALVVMMPEASLGAEFDIWPADQDPAVGHDHDQAHDHSHDHDHAHDHSHDHDHAGGHAHEHSHSHVRHVAVVARPLADRVVASLVYPDLVEGDYAVGPKGSGRADLRATVHGGRVTTVTWPEQSET